MYIKFIKNKKICVIAFIVFICVIALVICEYTLSKRINCTLMYESDMYTLNDNIVLKYNSFGIKEIKNDVLYNYNGGYMNEAVDMYDNKKNYFDFMKKRNGIKTNIEQDYYVIKYSIDIDKSELSLEDYKLVNVQDIMILKKKKDIKEYYEKKGYSCE